MSAGSVVGTPPRTIQLLVNARHLTGPKTGIEVYMEQLLQALAGTGEASITALTWAPLGLELPGVREVIPVRRPELAGVRAVLWKLWFDQWESFRAAAPKEGVVYHGMDGFLPYSLRSRIVAWPPCTIWGGTFTPSSSIVECD